MIWAKRLLAKGLCGAVALSGLAAIAGSHIVPRATNAIAQTTGEGLTIYGGVDAEFRLNYMIDNNKRRDTRARYYLAVPGRKITREIVELEITYPQAFEDNGGYFSRASVELREGNGRGQGSIPVEDVVFDLDRNIIEIYPAEPIPPNKNFVIVVSSVRNPNRYGQHYLNLRTMYRGDVLRQFVGIWPMDIAAE